MRFIDYECQDCNEISEIVIRGDSDSEMRCKKCGSMNIVKVFAPAGFKSTSSDSSLSSSSSCSGCSGGNCGICSG